MPQSSLSRNPLFQHILKSLPSLRVQIKVISDMLIQKDTNPIFTMHCSSCFAAVPGKLINSKTDRATLYAIISTKDVLHGYQYLPPRSALVVPVGISPSLRYLSRRCYATNCTPREASIDEDVSNVAIRMSSATILAAWRTVEVVLPYMIMQTGT
jgi:hypothetical protein